MADKFKYDPEGETEEGSKKYRLPFGICKAHGIQIQDWWRPKDAWEALRNRGIVKEPSEEYKKYYKELDKKRRAERKKAKDKRKAAIEAQEGNPEHMPEVGYKHQPGKIAGADKGERMTFDEADNGHCNPYYSTQPNAPIGYRTNCQTCVAVYVARRNGYDVRALPNLNNEAIYDLSRNTTLAYRDANGNHPTMVGKPYGAKTEIWLKNTMRDGDIYAIRGTWKGKNVGHIITAEKVNGEIKFYDPQVNKEYSAKDAQLQLWGGMTNISAFNVSNVTMDEAFCDKIMKKG